jgi:hypothetical protein
MAKEPGHFIFLSKITGFVFIAGLFLFGLGVSSAKAADPSILVYYLATADTTPLIRGTVSGPCISVFVVVGENEAQEAMVSGDGSWSLEWEPGAGEEALIPGDYAVGVATAIGAEIVSDSAYIYIEENYPFDIYYEEEGADMVVSSIIFPNDFTYTSAEEHFSLTFSAGTEITTETGDGTFNAGEWYAEGVTPNNERVILKLRFGVPDTSLDFSKDVAIIFDVGAEYEGQTLNIFSRSDGGDDGWESEATCTVLDGECAFSVSHASYFAVSESGSIAETEEGNESDDSEKAHIDSWKAYRYENADKSCSSRLKLIIKGKHFDKEAKVEIGDHEASSVNRKSSKEIVAKFCMNKLLDNQANHKKTISVTNPDTDTEKADKKINLDDIGYDMPAEDFDTQTAEGVKNIQTALAKLGLLDEKYITGAYGPITAEAVKKFQAQNGLPATGFVGPLTKAKLQEKIK